MIKKMYNKEFIIKKAPRKAKQRSLALFIDGTAQYAKVEPKLMEELTTERKKYEDDYNKLMTKIATAATFKTLKQLKSEEEKLQKGEASPLIFNKRELKLADLETIKFNDQNAICTAQRKGIHEHEGSACLLNDSQHPNNKLLQHGHDSWIEFDFKSAKTNFAGIGIKSANDCPERDPETIVISVQNYPDFTAWRKHHTLKVDFRAEQNRRWHEIKYVIPEV